MVRSLWLWIKFLQRPIAPRVFQNMSYMLVGSHVVIRGQRNPGVIREVAHQMAVVEFRLPLDDLKETPLAEVKERAIPRGPTSIPSMNGGSHEEARHRPQMNWSEETRLNFYRTWGERIMDYDRDSWAKCSQ